MADVTVNNASPPAKTPASARKSSPSSRLPLLSAFTNGKSIPTNGSTNSTPAASTEDATAAAAQQQVDLSPIKLTGVVTAVSSSSPSSSPASSYNNSTPKKTAPRRILSGALRAAGLTPSPVSAQAPSASSSPLSPSLSTSSEKKIFILTADQFAIKDQGADKWATVVPKSRVASVAENKAAPGEFSLTLVDDSVITLKAATQAEADGWTSAITEWLASSTKPLADSADNSATVTGPVDAAAEADANEANNGNTPPTATSSEIKVAEPVHLVQADEVPATTTSTEIVDPATSLAPASSSAPLAYAEPTKQRAWYQLWAGCCEAE